MRMLEVKPAAPHFVFPILDEVGVVLEFRLEVLEATPEDEHLMPLVFALHLQEIAGLGIYLRVEVTWQAEWRSSKIERTLAALGPLKRSHEYRAARVHSRADIPYLGEGAVEDDGRDVLCLRDEFVDFAQKAV